MFLLHRWTWKCAIHEYSDKMAAVILNITCRNTESETHTAQTGKQEAWKKGLKSLSSLFPNDWLSEWNTPAVWHSTLLLCACACHMCVCEYMPVVECGVHEALYSTQVWYLKACHRTCPPAGWPLASAFLHEVWTFPWKPPGEWLAFPASIHHSGANWNGLSPLSWLALP